jgi:hypothetical protein
MAAVVPAADSAVAVWGWAGAARAGAVAQEVVAQAAEAADSGVAQAVEVTVAVVGWEA